MYSCLAFGHLRRRACLRMPPPPDDRLPARTDTASCSPLSATVHPHISPRILSTCSRRAFLQGHLLPAPIPFLFPPGGGRSHDTPSSGRLVIGGTGRRSLTAFNFSSSESATCIPPVCSSASCKSTWISTHVAAHSCGWRYRQVCDRCPLTALGPCQARARLSPNIGFDIEVLRNYLTAWSAAQPSD